MEFEDEHLISFVIVICLVIKKGMTTAGSSLSLLSLLNPDTEQNLLQGMGGAWQPTRESGHPAAVREARGELYSEVQSI